ncbi:MAG: DUF362 domain-containing protein, partial [Chitinispirillaceae bacterium]|nr:DUF362 domain-containing protein [Chitinispirillaceae bacterium]
MTTKSKVWYTSIKENDNKEYISTQLIRLLEASNFLSKIKEGMHTEIKMHFGEEGNTGYVKPWIIKIIAEKIREKGGRVVVSDTNTLYVGRRTNSKDHLLLAKEHGFTEDSVNGKIEIPDDNESNSKISIPFNGKYISEAKTFKKYIETDFLVCVSHFKGHLVTGFGGAIKNIGMGCASREGKLSQHSSLSPLIASSLCIGCGVCIAFCPAKAISITNKKAHIDRKKCIGCATCIAVCKKEAIDVDWGSGADKVPLKMVEYAAAILTHIKQKIFINFAIHITAECDCLAMDDP